MSKHKMGGTGVYSFGTIWQMSDYKFVVKELVAYAATQDTICIGKELMTPCYLVNTS
jgi:hypothetical protein